jgi:hypothetical protein
MWVFIIIFVIFLILFAVIYEKWWIPRRCNKKGPDSNLHVDSWVWTSGNCLVSNCSNGYTLTNGSCVSEEEDPKTETRKYVSKSGKCNSKNPMSSTKVSDQKTCESLCGDNCFAYEYWDSKSSMPQQCNLYDTRPIQVNKETGAKCYILK